MSDALDEYVKLSDAHRSLLRENLETNEKLVKALQDHIATMEDLQKLRERNERVIEVMKRHMEMAKRLSPIGYGYDQGARQAILDYTETLCDNF